MLQYDWALSESQSNQRLNLNTRTLPDIKLRTWIRQCGTSPGSFLAVYLITASYPLSHWGRVIWILCTDNINELRCRHKIRLHLITHERPLLECICIAYQVRFTPSSADKAETKSVWRVRSQQGLEICDIQSTMDGGDSRNIWSDFYECATPISRHVCTCWVETKRNGHYWCSTGN